MPKGLARHPKPSSLAPIATASGVRIEVSVLPLVAVLSRHKREARFAAR